MQSRLTLGASVCGLFLSAVACGGHIAGAPTGGDGGPGSTVRAVARAVARAARRAGRRAVVPRGRPRRFTTPLLKTADKVDLLFDIDNSASMGDKQAYLAQAIPDLITRLVTAELRRTRPAASRGRRASREAAPTRARRPSSRPCTTCTSGSSARRSAARLGDACPTDPTNRPRSSSGPAERSPHNDDQAHLLSRTADPNNLTNYTEGAGRRRPQPDHFLDWFPPATVNAAQRRRDARRGRPGRRSDVLSTDFQQLVVGVHQFGCGIESQLESWYRFLIQPDPYASLDTTSRASPREWVGVDTTILAAARRLLAARLAGRDPRPDRRERLRGRRPLVRRLGVELHVHDVPSAARHLVCATTPG